MAGKGCYVDVVFLASQVSECANARILVLISRDARRSRLILFTRLAHSLWTIYSNLYQIQSFAKQKISSH